MERVLLVFAREPAPENTKTRLAGLFTDAERVAFYTAMLHDLAETVWRVACDRRVVCWSPERLPDRLCEVFGAAEYRPQEGVHLGERMRNALVWALGDVRGDRAAVLVGSDAPLLSADDLESAFTSLAHRSFVLAPSFDGGYALIGARSSVVSEVPYAFADIPWSRSDVLDTTVERLVQTHYLHPEVSLGVLGMCYDVDTPEDVRRLRAHLRALAFARERLPRHTFAFLRRHPA
jgi:rSAM/selenodomain-associated transferase 1